MTSKVDTPYRTEYVKTKVKNLRGALPGRAAVIVLEDRARIDDADDIQTVTEYLHDDDEEVTIIKDDGTVADERGTTCNSSGQVEVGRDSGNPVREHCTPGNHRSWGFSALRYSNQGDKRCLIGQTSTTGVLSAVNAYIRASTVLVVTTIGRLESGSIVASVPC